MVPRDPGGALMRADPLVTPVDGLEEALAAVDAFDRALADGLPRSRGAAGPDALAGAVAGTPLADRAAEAAAQAARGTAAEEHLLALAAARGALLGSAHDALIARIEEATGRPHAPHPTPPPRRAEPPADLPAAARSWLCDLARTGWRGIDHETVSGAEPVVSALLADPARRRLATLLDGFAAELAAGCPGATLDRVPVRRWADLWARAMLLTVPGAAGAPAADALTGRLLPLGVDLMEHPTAAQAQVHAVFEPADGGPPRLVRAAVSVPKPDTVVGAGVWQLLRPHLTLLAAAGEGRSMDLDGMPATAEGDLLWRGASARAGRPADPLATARVLLPTATAVAASPLDRHPARIAVPVLVEGRAAATGGDGTGLTLTVAGHPLAVDTDRLPVASPLTPRLVAASRECVGLLRWDAGRFALQPLAVRAVVRGRAVVAHAGAWAGGTADTAGATAEKAATDAVSVLRERAGRLLRK